ncbi:MAG: cyclic nucleotide-binding domain-containing protein [Nitrospirota bacterium]|nr:MAG: cyclic nucleotide-binding domain-containing protein [Nitrospirota bacterium]
MGSKDLWGKFHKALKKGDWPDAIAVIDRIIELEPKNPNHYLKKGDICQKKGDTEQASESYLRAAWYVRKSGFNKKALAVYKMVLRIDPKNEEAVKNTNEILNELEAPTKPALVVPPSPVPEPETPPADEPRSPAEPLPTEAPHEEMPIIETTSFEESSHSQIPDTEHVITDESKTESTVTTDEGSFIEPTSLVAEEESVGGEGGPEKVDVPEFFSSFKDEEIWEIMSRAETRKYSDGETIVQEGDTGDSMYIIKSGSVKVVAHILGREIDLASLSKGDLFGEVAYLTGRPRTANVIAAEDSEIYEIGRALLDDIVERRPEIMSNFNEIYNERVKDTIDKVKSN